MALKLKIDYRGIEADYWKIIGCRTDYRSNIEIVDLALYVNQEARIKSVKNFLEVRKFVFPVADLDRKGQYEKIKEPVLNEKKENTNIFSDAENV